jgi:NAD(P)-dependent dehydrogenase (short-subunit alcohol dehydrogenase family)
VVVADVDPVGEEVAAGIVALGGRALYLKHDVSDEASWERTIGQTLHAFGGLDILVNNAGIVITSPVAEMTLTDWRKVMAVNLDGVFLGTKHGLVAMRLAGLGGSIINVSSASGLIGSPTASAYCASKGGIRLFTKAVALECATEGIRVNSLHPGAVRTPMWKKTQMWSGLVERHGGEEAAWKALAASTPAKRVSAPEEIAEAILFLASDGSKFVTGSELVVDGGFTAG